MPLQKELKLTPENFCRWLQGFAELTSYTPDAIQWQIIKDHLNLVFDKVTPTYRNDVKINVGDYTQHDTRFPQITIPQYADYSIGDHIPGIRKYDLVC
jgi:hypothetical protein